MRDMVRKNQGVGRLIDYGVRLKEHEQATVDYFLSRGDKIELIIPSNTAKNKNPDWIMWGKIWEAKSPQTTNANTLIKRLKHASKQAGNLIIDLRRVKGDEKTAAKIIQSKFESSSSLKRLVIIMKNGDLVVRERKS